MKLLWPCASSPHFRRHSWTAPGPGSDSESMTNTWQSAQESKQDVSSVVVVQIVPAASLADLRWCASLVFTTALFVLRVKKYAIFLFLPHISKHLWAWEWQQSAEIRQKSHNDTWQLTPLMREPWSIARGTFPTPMPPRKEKCQDEGDCGWTFCAEIKQKHARRLGQTPSRGFATCLSISDPTFCFLLETQLPRGHQSHHEEEPG